MNSYLKRIRRIFLITIMFSLLLTFFGVYKPMVNEIESNALVNFNLLAEAKIDAFLEVVDKDLQATKGLSSRSAIRDKIVEYLKGETDFESLQAFSKEKYLEGISIIDNLKYAYRLVENKRVTEYYTENCTCDVITENLNVTEIEYEFKIEEGQSYLEVISPVFSGTEIVGYDYTGFFLNDTLVFLNRDDGIKIEIVNENNESKEVEGFENLFQDEKNIYFNINLDNDNSIVVTGLKSDVFKNRDRLIIRSIVFIIVGYILILLIIYFFVVRYAKKKILDLALDRDIYKSHADKDNLTGACSRLFLEDFVRNHPFENGILMMLDLDNFKKINDFFGHIAGDEVLKYTVSVIKNAVRTDDIVVRYGGDEFIIILRDTISFEYGEELINRIKTELSEQNKFEFPLKFSYGMVFVKEMISIKESIDEADKKMYKNKTRRN